MTAGADPNAQDRNGQTAVHMCATHGYIRCLLEIMKANGKDLNLEIQNFNGLTALHVAVQNNRKNIVEVLIKYGVNLNTKVMHLFIQAAKIVLSSFVCLHGEHQYQFSFVGTPH